MPDDPLSAHPDGPSGARVTDTSEHHYEGPLSPSDRLHRDGLHEYVPTATEEVLWEVASLLINDDAHLDVFQTLATAMGRLVRFDLLIVAAVDHEKRMVRPFFAVGESKDHYLAHNELPFGTTVIGRAAAQGMPIFVNDLHLDPRNTHVPGTDQTRPQSAIGVPLFEDAEITAVFFISRLGDDHHFSRQECGIVRRFAQLAQGRLAGESARARLTLASVTDPLTGVFNRREFERRLALSVQDSEKAGQVTSLIVFDIDDFKQINDRFGHDTGDRVLVRVAETAQASLRTDDVVCRVGGEEFAILLPAVGASLAAQLAERIRSSIEAIEMGDGLSVTVSIGIASSSLGDHSADELYREADRSMYRAKSKGKNQVGT